MLVGLNFVILPLKSVVVACILSLLIFAGGIGLGLILGRKERHSVRYLYALALFLIATVLPIVFCRVAPVLFSVIRVNLQPLSLGDLLTYYGTLAGLVFAWLTFIYEQKQKENERAERECVRSSRFNSKKMVELFMFQLPTARNFPLLIFNCLISGYFR